MSGVDQGRAMARWVLLCYDADLYKDDDQGLSPLDRLLYPLAYVLENMGMLVYMEVSKAVRVLDWAAVMLHESQGEKAL